MRRPDGGRRAEKVRGGLFTCLTTRAVYLDVAVSMASENFLLVLCRFIGLYGKPKRIHSDSEINFVGAEHFLWDEILKLHHSDATQTFIKNQTIEWRFQPVWTENLSSLLVRIFINTDFVSLISFNVLIFYCKTAENGFITADTLRTILSKDSFGFFKTNS